MKPLKRAESIERAHLSNGILWNDCRGCGHTFCDDLPSCIGCLAGAVHRFQRVESIVIRDGIDTELPEGCVSIVNDLVDALSFCDTEWKGSFRCRMCKASPERVMNAVWSGLPTRGLNDATIVLSTFQTQDARCMECIRRSMRSLDEIRRAVEMMR